MNNDNFLIENSDLDIVREFCACINDSNKRSCAVSNKLAAEIAKKYFTEIELDPVTSLHEIPQVLEKIEVSDIYIKNNYIDVRLYFEDEPLFIPKSHFDNNMLPLAYMFIMVNKDLSGATVTGFMLTSDIEANFAGDYLQVSEDDLISYYDLENNLVLNNIEDIDEDFEVNIHNYLDSKLSDTAEFYNLLIKSPEARTKLKNAAKAKEIIKFISIADCESTLDSEANSENAEQNFEETELDVQDNILESNETIDLQVSDSDDGLISLEPVSDTSFEELTIHEDVDMLENTEMASDFILDEDISNETIIEDLTTSNVQEESEILSEPIELSTTEETEVENLVTENIEDDMKYDMPLDDSTVEPLDIANESNIVELEENTESFNETSEDILPEDNYLLEEETAPVNNYEIIENNVEDSEEIVDENIIIQEEADAVQELVLDNNEIVEDNISETIPEEETPYVTNTTPSLTSIEDFDEDELMKELEQIAQPVEEGNNEEVVTGNDVASPEIEQLFQDNNISADKNNNEGYYETAQTQRQANPLKFVAILALLASLGYFGYTKFINNGQSKNYTPDTNAVVTKATNKAVETPKPVAMPNETVENTKVEQTNEGISTDAISTIEKNLDTSILVSNLSIKWEVPAAYISSGTAKRYFTKLGKILQLNLKTELLLLTKTPVTNKICVEIEYDKTKQKFAVKKVTESSGDKNIDEIIVSTINNALNINLNMNMSIFENITGNPVLVINL